MVITVCSLCTSESTAPCCKYESGIVLDRVLVLMDHDTLDCVNDTRMLVLPGSHACFRNIVHHPRHHHHLGELGICPHVGVKGSASEERLRGEEKLPSVRRLVRDS